MYGTSMSSLIGNSASWSKPPKGPPQASDAVADAGMREYDLGEVDTYRIDAGLRIARIWATNDDRNCGCPQKSMCSDVPNGASHVVDR